MDRITLRRERAAAVDALVKRGYDVKVDADSHTGVDVSAEPNREDRRWCEAFVTGWVACASAAQDARAAAECPVCGGGAEPECACV